MSDPEGSKTINTAPNEADSNCGCDNCTAPAPSTSKPQPNKRRYVPPQPDSNTFLTQQAFLESLTPVPIEIVDQACRKCPICWKPFGEAPDPGFDNTEQPVQLRCGHVFGDKCLAITFGIPKISKIDILPLSFSPRSQGHSFGQKLHSYATQHARSFENHAKMFEKMLEESHQPNKGRELFGDYWWPIVLELQRCGGTLNDIIFLENAVILDFEAPKRQINYPPIPSCLKPGSLPTASTIADKTLSETTAGLPSSSSLPKFHDTLTPSAMALDWSSLALEAKSTSVEGNAPPPPPPLPPHVQFLSPFPPATAAPKPAANPTGNLTDKALLTKPPLLPTWEGLLAASEATMTWKEALGGETQLDKLAALQKQAKKNTIWKEPFGGEDQLNTLSALEKQIKQDAVDSVANPEAPPKGPTKAQVPQANTLPMLSTGHMAEHGRRLGKFYFTFISELRLCNLSRSYSGSSHNLLSL